MAINKGLLYQLISDQLDISPTMYKKAVDRYTSVSKYLASNGIESDFYPQGSFRYGTVIRPISKGEERDYDIDVVCQLYDKKVGTTPADVKNVIGDALKNNDTYKKLLDKEGKRCWTLQYAEQDGVGFHLDVLPVVSEEQKVMDELTQVYRVPPYYATTSVAITNFADKQYTWSTSNPKGYGTWFDEINQPFLSDIVASGKRAIFESYKGLYESIDDVPSQLVRTPLQRVIQILKRHRDVRFSGHELEDDKPISMIITTLICLIVKNESVSATDTYALLKFVVEYLAKYIGLIDEAKASFVPTQNAVIRRDKSNNRWFIPNPVNPKENFADRWHENNNQKAKAFFDWISWIKEDMVDALNNTSFTINSLGSIFGKPFMQRINEQYESQVKPIPNITISNPIKPYGV